MAYDSAHTCDCGCGETVPATHSKGRYRRYINATHRGRAGKQRRRAELFPKLPANHRAPRG